MIKRISHRTILYTIVCVLLCSTLFGYLPPAVETHATSLSELQEKQKEVQKKLSEAKSQLKTLEGQINKEASYQKTLNNQIKYNNEQIDLLEQEIDLLTEQIAQKEAEIAAKQAEIEGKQGEIEDSRSLFQQRMRVMYMSSDTSTLEILFASKNFSEFLTNIEMMKAISTHDTKLIGELRLQKNELQQQERELDAMLAEIEADKENVILQREAIKAAQSELEVAYSKSKSAMQDLAALEKKYERDKEAAAKEDAEIEAAIEQWYRDYYANNSDSGIISEDHYVWPLPGYSYISSGYGPRWGSFHSGIDITGGGVYGANIVASRSGKVIQATTHWSYGNYVIVDHGDGYSTLYAHASKLLVNVGDFVVQGQAVALCGSTGQSSGPHLHFEVRKNGTRQNPVNFVKYGS